METNPLLIAWTILTLHQLIHIIEPVWGAQELLKFALLTQVSSRSENAAPRPANWTFSVYINAFDLDICTDSVRAVQCA